MPRGEGEAVTPGFFEASVELFSSAVQQLFSQPASVSMGFLGHRWISARANAHPATRNNTTKWLNSARGTTAQGT